MKTRYAAAMEALYVACMVISGASLVVITLIIPYGVFMRYVLNAAASWPEPLAVLLMIVFSFLGGAAVNAVLAQRLIRRLCTHCKAQDKPGEELSEFLSMQGLDTDLTWVSKGCDRCRHTGFSGRVGIYELLAVDDQVGTFREGRHRRVGRRVGLLRRGHNDAHRRPDLLHRAGEEVLQRDAGALRPGVVVEVHVARPRLFSEDDAAVDRAQGLDLSALRHLDVAVHRAEVAVIDDRPLLDGDVAVDRHRAFGTRGGVDAHVFVDRGVARGQQQS